MAYVLLIYRKECIKNMVENFLINFNGQIYSISVSTDMFDNLIKLIKIIGQRFNVNYEKYEIAIKVLNAAKNKIQNNIKIPQLTKTEMKVTIDVLKEIRTYNVSNEQERQYIENVAEYFKSLVDLKYSLNTNN